jgi:hypothetical protein
VLRYYLDGRRFEWAMTIPMLVVAVLAFVWPKTLTFSAFHWILTVMSPATVEISMFLIGWFGMIGLLLNGHKVRGVRAGPVIRSLCAIARAVMWSQFSLALLRLSIAQGFPSPGLPFWITFTIFEIDVAYRAVAGNGNSSRAV